MAPTNPALHRYDDAYSVASALVRHGKRYKSVGSVALFLCLLIGGLSLLLVMAGAGQQNPFGTGFGGPSAGMLEAIGGLVMSAGIGAVGIWMIQIGTLLSAHGQLLLAQLDIAIHTSPFLDIEEKRIALDFPATASAGHTVDRVTCGHCSAPNPAANQYCESCGRQLSDAVT